MRAAAKERRSRVRQKSFLQGRVFFNKGRSSFDCLVRDFSELGAKLKVSENATLPEVVELYVPSKDETLRARVQWRTDDEVGVAFGEEGEAPSIVLVASADLSGRVLWLESELMTLRARSTTCRTSCASGSARIRSITNPLDRAIGLSGSAGPSSIAPAWNFRPASSVGR